MENSVPSPQVDCDVIEHTLNERDRISVQPGDVIGIELPPLFDQAFQVLFEPGGELNYIYRQQLPDTVELQGPSLSSVFREQALIDLTVIPGIYATVVASHFAHKPRNTSTVRGRKREREKERERERERTPMPCTRLCKVKIAITETIKQNEDKQSRIDSNTVGRR